MNFGLRLILLSGIFAAQSLAAQAGVWQPVGTKQIAIWPGAVPDAQPGAGIETAMVRNAKKPGTHWTEVRNVTVPTISVFAAKGKNTGAAVMVFPGGGYQILAIDTEGTEACDWLTERGVNCIVLKYRVTTVGAFPLSGPYPESPMALEDAQRAMGVIREHAVEWGIDPHKVGVMGFSAGGHLVAALSTHFKERIYKPVDAADAQSCRPDFAIAVYPGHLHWQGAIDDSEKGKTAYRFPKSQKADKNLSLNPEVPVTRETPPTFLIQNEDDDVDSVYDAISYYIGLQKAGVKVEMHLYAEGGHAFGLRPSKLAVSEWPHLLERWLKTIGVVGE